MLSNVTWWQKLHDALYGPNSDRYTGVSLAVTGRRRWAAVQLSMVGTGCVYSVVPDPEHANRFMVFVSGTLTQLRQFLDNTTRYPDLIQP